MHKFIWNSALQAVCLVSHTEGFCSPNSTICFTCRVMHRDKGWQVAAKIHHSVTVAALLTIQKSDIGVLCNCQ
jgi:hypothetical protein